jgi:hypothetical protein
MHFFAKKINTFVLEHPRGVKKAHNASYQTYSRCNTLIQCIEEGFVLLFFHGRAVVLMRVEKKSCERETRVF